jgi:hypothetical protein
MATILAYALLTVMILLIQGFVFLTMQNSNKSERAKLICPKSRSEFEWPSEVNVKSVSNSSLYDGIAAPRIWDPWPIDRKLPCVPIEEGWWHTRVQRSPTKRGLLFVKEMKTGSSSVGGVVLRLARQLPKRYGYDFEMCSARVDHANVARIMDYKNRIPDESYLFTFIREPSARLISQFFHFQVSREKKEVSDINIQQYFLNVSYFQNYYLNDLSLLPYEPGVIPQRNKREYQERKVAAILKDYDFIGITERMDESLVVLQLLLHLPTSDILYVIAKSKGGFDDGAFHQTCTYIIPSYTSPTMKQWFKTSPQWKNKTYGDSLLYQAACRSLDLTIDALGRDLVEEKLKKFKLAQTLVQERCSSNLRLPCSPDGVRAKAFDINYFDTDCLWLDSGCGHACLDEISDEVNNL